MWRILHSWTGLLLSIFVVVMSLTGTILATRPIYENLQSQVHFSDLSVAEVVHNVARKNRRITPIEISIMPNGIAKIQFTRPSGSVVNRYINLATGKFQNNPSEHPFYEWVDTLHTNWFMARNGEWISLTASIAMLIFVISGFFLLVRRVGGIRHLFSPISWKSMAGTHSALSRWFFIPLAIIAFTAVYMGMVGMGWVPTGDSQPARTVGSEARGPKNTQPWTLPGLQISMSGVTQIVYPISDDPTDSWTVYTHQYAYSIDQYTGKVLLKSPLPLSKRIYHYILFLHTAQGSTFWAIILMLASLGIPVFAFTGLWSWTKKQIRKGGPIRHNSSVRGAQIVILVGSETFSTWGFARALHRHLHQAGFAVKTQEMNQLSARYPHAKAILALTSTYGDGKAPQSASRFMRRLQRFHPMADQQFAVLAFGDKSFSTYCQFAQEADAALAQAFDVENDQTKRLLPYTDIDKQSAQRFGDWSRQLGEALGVPLNVDYTPARPRTYRFVLDKKTMYGEAVGQCIAVLRFKAQGYLPRHAAGDLLSVYHPDTSVPRLYSLGSSRQAGFVEFCVRRQEGGLCSTWLTSLQEGDTLDANVVINDRFHAPQTRKPLILVGAGTGMGPLVGFIRANRHHHPIYLFWGGRHPDSDALYKDEIANWMEEKKLTAFFVAWSRLDKKVHVQDVLEQERALLKTLMADGATVMICGGSKMAEGVYGVFQGVAEDLQTSVAQWQRKQRYLQDVY